MLSHMALIAIDFSGFGQGARNRDDRAHIRFTKTTAKKTTVTTV